MILRDENFRWCLGREGSAFRNKLMSLSWERRQDQSRFLRDLGKLSLALPLYLVSTHLPLHLTISTTQNPWANKSTVLLGFQNHKVNKLLMFINYLAYDFLS